eukprot:Clim_evm1s74 gene=Clim_evmTU1s74
MDLEEGLDGYEGFLARLDVRTEFPNDGSIEDQVKEAKDANIIAIFAKSGCPFCHESKKILYEENIDPTKMTVYNIDKFKESHAGTIQDTLQKLTGSRTVPSIWVRGTFEGGCSDLKAKQHNGTLDGILSGLRVPTSKAVDLNAFSTIKHDNGKVSDDETHMLLSPGIRNVKGNVHDVENRMSWPPADEDTDSDEKVILSTLFYFPHTLNRWVVQVSGVLVFITCIILAAFYDHEYVKWASLGFFLDFVVRFMFGGKASIIGSLGALIVSIPNPEPQFVAGAPKQFAQFIGVFCSGMAALLFFVNAPEGAVVFLAMLAGGSGGEGFINFCLGCKIFAMGVNLGIVPKNIYNEHIVAKREVEWQYNFRFGEYLNKVVPVPSYALTQASLTSDTKKSTEHDKTGDEGSATPKTSGKHVAVASGNVSKVGTIATHTTPTWQWYVNPKSKPTAVDFRWKAGKGDDVEMRHMSIIKHCRPTIFTPGAILIGLAVLFRIMTAFPRYNAPEELWKTFAILGAIYVIWAICVYGARLILYPRKVYKDLTHFQYRNFFAMPGVILSFSAFLAQTQYALDLANGDDSGYGDLAKALFWIGFIWIGVLQLFLFAEWYVHKHELQHITGVILLPAVAGTTLALVAPIIDLDYLPLAQLLLGGYGGLALFLLIPFMQKIQVQPFHVDEKRNGPNIFPVAVNVLAIATSVVLAGNGWFDFTGWVPRALFGLGILLELAIFSTVFWNFLGRIHFVFEYFAWGFSVLIIAFATVLFDQSLRTDASWAFSWICISIACYVNAVLFLNFVESLLHKTIFLRKDEWGPISFMKMTHYAMREMMGAIEATVAAIDAEAACTEEATDQTSLARLAGRWAEFQRLYAIHSRQEDHVLFPTADRFFPGFACTQLCALHSEEEGLVENFNSVALSYTEQIKTGVRTAKMGELTEAFAAFKRHFEHHLYTEETTVVKMMRKYLNSTLQMKVNKKCWRIMSEEEQEFFLPTVVQNLPVHYMRVKFIRTWMWAQPEMKEIIGQIIFRGVDTMTWLRIVRDIPDLIPRNLKYWHQYK